MRQWFDEPLLHWRVSHSSPFPPCTFPIEKCCGSVFSPQQWRCKIDAMFYSSFLNINIHSFFLFFFFSTVNTCQRGFLSCVVQCLAGFVSIHQQLVLCVQPLPPRMEPAACQARTWIETCQPFPATPRVPAFKWLLAVEPTRCSPRVDRTKLSTDLLALLFHWWVAIIFLWWIVWQTHYTD